MELVTILKTGKPERDIAHLPEAAGQILASMPDFYKKAGFQRPWVGYLAIEGDRCVGTCAFKTPPSDGRVEIAYFTFPENEGKGIATAMAKELIQIAKQQDAAITVTAQTLPEQNASTSILMKLGFQLVGEILHPEDGKVWEWHLPPLTSD